MNFSIVTPSFGQLEWLRLCVASVADQPGVTAEHIVQDAGSTDGTCDWLLSDSRVKAFIEKDAGMYDAINRGLRRARGDVLAYLNCDEQYLPAALERVHRYFVAHPEIEVLFTDALLIDSDGKPVSYRRAVLPTSRHIRLCHLNTLSCATFFRRSVIEKGHFFDPRWKAIGDAVWVENLLRTGIRMACLREPCAAFAFTGSNLGQTEASQREMDRWQPSRPFLLKAAVSTVHRLRKALAGAYRRRTADVKLYTRTSLGQREQFTGLNLDFGWPDCPAKMDQAVFS